MPQDHSLIQEIFRKLIHLNTLYIILLYEFLGKKFTLFILVCLLIIALEIEYFRIEHGKRIPILHKLFRAKEKTTFGGHIFLCISAIIVISVFSKEVAILAILMATFGDAAAAVFGKAYGKHFIPHLKNKAIEGVLAEFVVNIIIGYAYLFIFAQDLTQTMNIVLISMATIATITETTCGKLDDNLMIPIFAGITGEIMLFLIPFLYLI